MTQPRIGIYAGTFNPVHTGHITFALQAMEAAELEAVYFLPERQPWRPKQQVEHFAHRVAMLKQASLPHPQFHVMELDDVRFTVQRTLPKLQQHFAGSQLVFLFGSDIVSGLPNWTHIEQLLQQSELVIGLRQQDDLETVKQQIEGWAVQPKVLSIFTSYAPHISSSSVRDALQRRTQTQGLLKSVQRYSDHHWLYVSLAEPKR